MFVSVQNKSARSRLCRKKKCVDKLFCNPSDHDYTETQSESIFRKRANGLNGKKLNAF